MASPIDTMLVNAARHVIGGVEEITLCCKRLPDISLDSAQKVRSILVEAIERLQAIDQQLAARLA